MWPSEDDDFATRIDSELGETWNTGRDRKTERSVIYFEALFNCLSKSLGLWA